MVQHSNAFIFLCPVYHAWHSAAFQFECKLGTGGPHNLMCLPGVDFGVQSAMQRPKVNTV